MQPTYTITVDRTRSLLHLKFFGFFDREARLQFIADRDRAVTELGCAPNQHLTLCDAREATVMSQESIEDFQKAIGDPRYSSRRLAFIMTSALIAMQAKRVINRNNVMIFTDQNTALEWLLFED